MTGLDEFVAIGQPAKYPAVYCHTLRGWDRDRKIPVYRNPISRYRLFRKIDLEEMQQRIEESRHYPTGWRRDAPRKRKPR